MKRKRKKDPKNYVYPSWMANAMKKVSMQLQYEMSMMSMSFILIGIIITGIYMAFFVTGLALWYKIVLLVNLVAGMGFLTSFLITTFQQYQSYMSAQEFQKSLKGGNLE